MKATNVSKSFKIMNLSSELVVLKIIANQNKLNLRIEHEDLEARDILRRSIKEN